MRSRHAIAGKLLRADLPAHGQHPSDNSLIILRTALATALRSDSGAKKFCRRRGRANPRVSRWRDAAMVERWVISAWLLAEKHFRRIDVHRHLWSLAAILGRKTESSKQEKVA